MRLKNCIEDNECLVIIPPTTVPQTIVPTTAPQTIVPTAEPQTIVPTPEPSCGEDLIVSNNSDCVKLFENGWKTITVNEGLCNEVYSNLIIRNYSCLQEILVKKNSLKNLISLTISNNTQLNRIMIEDGANNGGALYNVSSVVISSMLIG